MKLRIPNLEECQQVRHWRNESMESLRTPYELTYEMQDKFYHNVICNHNSPHRYWSIVDKDKFVGFGGLTFIERENRLARISLIIAPEHRDEGLGEKAVDLILDKAFNYLNLKTVCGECYACNSAKYFWDKIVNKHKAFTAILPKRKYWEGCYKDSVYFSFDKDDYAK